MCIIIEQKLNYTLPWEMLETACFNNPHGYGLVIKDPRINKLQVIRKLTTDAKEIYDLLKDNEDCLRYLHLRWRTEGDINEENLHPFCVFHSDARQIYFMHNGTLPFEFKPTVNEKISDSKKFNDNWLTPFLTRLHGPSGKGDYHDEFFLSQLKKIWTGDHNRGLLISNDLQPLYINKVKWETIKDGKGDDFFASNDTYFKSVVRGPEFERRKKEKEEAEKSARKFPKIAENTNSKNTTQKVLFNLKDVNLKSKPSLTDDLSDIFEDVDLYSEDGYGALVAVTSTEFDELCLKEPGTASSLLVLLSSEYYSLLENFRAYKKAVEKARESKDWKDLPKK